MSQLNYHRNTRISFPTAGEGTCSGDTDCLGSNSICETGNCPSGTADCCRQGCDEKEEGSCCTVLDPGDCREGEGDCDTPDECIGGHPYMTSALRGEGGLAQKEMYSARR